MSKVDRFWSHEAQSIRCVRESDYDRDVNAWQERALTAEAKQAQQGEPHNCERDGHLPIGWGGPVFCELCSARLPDEPELDKAAQPAAADERPTLGYTVKGCRQAIVADLCDIDDAYRADQIIELVDRAALAPAAAVVMPERMTTIPEGKTISYAAGYEAALDAVANLNRNTVPLELLERISRWPCADHINAIDELRAILGAKP